MIENIPIKIGQKVYVVLDPECDKFNMSYGNLTLCDVAGISVNHVEDEKELWHEVKYQVYSEKPLFSGFVGEHQVFTCLDTALSVANDAMDLYIDSLESMATKALRCKKRSDDFYYENILTDE